MIRFIARRFTLGKTLSLILLLGLVPAGAQSDPFLPLATLLEGR
jgi:hypothetical protein